MTTASDGADVAEAIGLELACDLLKTHTPRRALAVLVVAMGKVMDRIEPPLVKAVFEGFARVWQEHG